MQITFKLYAMLSEYLPDHAVKNAIEIDITPETTAYELIDSYKIPRNMAHLVLLNGVYLKPEEREQPIIKAGDTLAIWPPVAGG